MQKLQLPVRDLRNRLQKEQKNAKMPKMRPIPYLQERLRWQVEASESGQT